MWSHPAIVAKPDLSMLVPLTSHSDCVPVTQQGAQSMSLNVLSCSSPLGIGCTLDTHLLSSAMPSSITCHKQTRGNVSMQPLLKKWNWSLEALGSGYHPRQDEHGHVFTTGRRALLAGTQIAGGWRFADYQHRSFTRNRFPKVALPGHRNSSPRLSIRLSNYLFVGGCAKPPTSPPSHGFDHVAHRPIMLSWFAFLFCKLIF